MDWELIWSNIFFEFMRLLKAPLLVPEIWWIITPLIVMTLTMTFYYGKYVHEKLGWNSAMSNNVVLLFVGIDLLRVMVHYTSPPSIDELFGRPGVVLAILIVMMERFLLARAAFEHRMSQRFMFWVSSPLVVNMQAYVLIVVVYTQYKSTIYTLIAALLLFGLLALCLRLLQELEHLRFGYHRKDFEKVKNGMKRSLRSK